MAYRQAPLPPNRTARIYITEFVHAEGCHGGFYDLFEACGGEYEVTKDSVHPLPCLAARFNLDTGVIEYLLAEDTGAAWYPPENLQFISKENAEPQTNP